MCDISDPELYGLVRKLYQGRFAWRVRKAGGDEDDCFQEILRSIHVRNHGKHPYDPSKGAPSNWAYQVCRSVVVNHVDKLARKWWLDLGSGEDVTLWERDQSGPMSEEDIELTHEEMSLLCPGHG